MQLQQARARFGSDASRMPRIFKPLPREAAEAAQDEIERARKRAKKDQEKAADELFEFDAAWNRHKSATQSSDKAGKVEGLCTEKTCLCCDKPAVGKSKFCDVTSIAGHMTTFSGRR